MSSSDVYANAGDIFFVRGASLLSRAIRFTERHIGSGGGAVNHVGVIVTDGLVQNVTEVEALSHVRIATLWRSYASGGDRVAIYRDTRLTPTLRASVATRARQYVGDTYGYGKIILHFLDWCLFGAYVFRRLGGMDRYPICSWVVAFAYFRGASITFGTPPAEASPNTIYAHVVAHPEWFMRVRELEALTP
jgi:hypothetical protein